MGHHLEKGFPDPRVLIINVVGSDLPNVLLKDHGKYAFNTSRTNLHKDPIPASTGQNIVPRLNAPAVKAEMSSYKR